MKAYVFLNTKPGTSEDVLHHLTGVAKIQGVVQVDSIYGRFDAIITLEASNLAELGELVYRVIEQIPNVTHTETALVLPRHQG